MVLLFRTNTIGVPLESPATNSHAVIVSFLPSATKAKGTTSAPKLYNVAQKAGAVAFQTSTGWGGVASRAIDNNISSRWNS